jgi:hypothetical protein
MLPPADQDHIVSILPRRQLNLAKENEIINEEIAGLHNGSGVSGECSEIKKVFVEPTISVPVDVLEATTFFQAATSGVTN